VTTKTDPAPEPTTETDPDPKVTDPVIEPKVTEPDPKKKEPKPGEPDPVDPEQLVKDAVTAASDAFAEQMETAIDRRTTSLMKTLASDYGLTKKTKDPATETEPAPDPNAIRALRAALRDEVAAEFEDPAERKLALSLAKQMGEARGLASDEDEDEVAGEIVKGVKSFLEEASSQAEAAVTADYKRRGLLKEDDPTQPPAGGGTDGPGTSPAELFKKGGQAARDRYATTEE